MKKLIFLLCLLIPVNLWAGTYNIATNETTVNGNTRCDGACDSTDTLIINGGPRGPLSLQNFNGNGDYITIKNSSSSRVLMSGAGYATIELRNCRYVDLRGDNLGGETYGIKLTSTTKHNAIWVRGASANYIKISYIEMDGNSHTGGGVLVQDGEQDQTLIYHHIELHHNYIHDTYKAGMYIGDDEGGVSDPWTSDILVHDNLFVDMGSYGMVLKYIHADSSPCEIYNNQILPSNRSSGMLSTYHHPDAYPDGENSTGISVHHFYGSSYAKIYDNRIEKTYGTGIRTGTSRHQIYDNLVLGCGTVNNSSWGYSIISYYGGDDIDAYDNIIIQPYRYGLYAKDATASGGFTISRNLVCDSTITGWGAYSSGDIVISTGANANTYYSNCSSFGFTTWSDDNDYSNDDFTIGGGDPDTQAPTPNPMTFSSNPAAASTGQIDMTASTATDLTTPINYYFDFDPDTDDCGSSADIGTGGTDSGAQESDTTYSDSGLQVNKVYCYETYACDSVGTPNCNTPSASVSAYTLAATPGAPTLSAGTDPTTQISFDLLDENGNPTANPDTQFACKVTYSSQYDYDWQDKWIQTATGTAGASEDWAGNATWDALGDMSGLNPSTDYKIACKAKNEDGIETALGTETSISTNYPPVSGEGEVAKGVVMTGVNFN